MKSFELGSACGPDPIGQVIRKKKLDVTQGRTRTNYTLYIFLTSSNLKKAHGLKKEAALLAIHVPDPGLGEAKGRSSRN